MRISLLLAFLSSLFIPFSTFAYPGCSTGDMVIWGQVWASCNALTKGKWSDIKTGWFLSGDRYSTFISYTGLGSRLEFQKKQTQKDIPFGPCAKGYRVPTRGEWETAIYYSRLNGTNVATLLWLWYNGGYRSFRDTDGDIMIESRSDMLGAYWSSTYEDIWWTRPIILHIWTRSHIDGTDGVYRENAYKFQYGENGLELVGGEESEMANVRCIRR